MHANTRPARRAGAARAPWLGLLISALLALLPAQATAQILNVQPLIAADDTKQGPTLAIEGGADIRRGNTDLLNFTGSFIGQYRSGRHLAFILLRGEYSEGAGETLTNKDLEHLRYRVSVTGPFAMEAFVQHDRDEFRRLALRTVAGVGPRLHIVSWAGLQISLGAAYMFEFERLAKGDEPDAGDDLFGHRLSSYVVMSMSVAESLSIGFTMYLQPRLTRWSDVRVLGETSLVSKITKRLATKMTLTNAFDSAPPAGVLPLDTTLKASLQVSY